MSADALAFRATLHCLVGCVLGEVSGMALGLSLGLGDAATIALAVALAFVFGYALTMVPLVRAGTPLRTALGAAFAADTVSVAIMETIDNAFVLAVPGAMHAGLGDPLLWAAIAAGFVVAFPFAFLANRWLIRRGGGHGAHGRH